jgi:hypothetical protein
LEVIDPAHDSLVAYPVCARCAKSIAAAGTMFRPEKVIAYLV